MKVEELLERYRNGDDTEREAISLALAQLVSANSVSWRKTKRKEKAETRKKTFYLSSHEVAEKYKAFFLLIAEGKNMGEAYEEAFEVMTTPAGKPRQILKEAVRFLVDLPDERICDMHRRLYPKNPAQWTRRDWLEERARRSVSKKAQVERKKAEADEKRKAESSRLSFWRQAKMAAEK